MEYEAHIDPMTGDRVFHLRITQNDVLDMGIPNSFDQLLFDECNASMRTSDKLLGLERMARLIEEGQRSQRLERLNVKSNVPT